MHCKLCKFDTFETVINFQKYPDTISNLFSSPQAATKGVTQISFLKCKCCNHIQISEDMPQSFYDEYVMTVSHSNKMKDFQNEQADFFISKFNLKGKKVLEVGCGDGNFLEILVNKGCDAQGNEPSRPFRELALRKNLKVDSHFVNEDYKNSDAPFDAIISREVMEHIPEPIDFLRNIRKFLADDGVVLIEIPNSEKMLRESRYYDLFPDHLSYFTKETLTLSMLLSGFKDVEIYYGMDEEFIYATAKNNILNTDDLINAFRSISNDFVQLTNSYNYIIVWGAGGKGIATLGSLEDACKIKYVVDADTFKHGKYLPSSGLLVKPVEELFNDSKVDALVITNLAYLDEVIKTLHINNFRKKVFALSKNGLLEITL
jgi:2-polyprenyl-3-methyl-5-hydroxy-6-metoxy-1,4-benzoquinol methylase